MKYLVNSNHIHVEDEDKERLKEIIAEENIPLGRSGSLNAETFFKHGSGYHYIVMEPGMKGLLWGNRPDLVPASYEFRDIISDYENPIIFDKEIENLIY